jgi:phosphopantetheinyl transferase
MGRPVWRDVLEWVQLGPEERAALGSSGGNPTRATLRLWGRIAAKEAVRRLWLEQGGAAVFPADFAIDTDAHGRPTLRSLLETERQDLPAISIAHTDGVAVAIASLDPSARVGIDVERLVERSAGFEANALLDSERTLLDALAPSQRAEWVARIWCAKEAVGKATAFGLLGGPLGIETVSLDAHTGILAMVLGAELSEACPALAQSRIEVYTARRSEYIWACTLGEGSAR